MIDNLQCGPGPICKCCHDDAQGIIGGLCPDCREHSAKLLAEIERLRKLCADRPIWLDIWDSISGIEICEWQRKIDAEGRKAAGRGEGEG